MPKFYSQKSSIVLAVLAVAICVGFIAASWNTQALADKRKKAVDVAGQKVIGPYSHAIIADDFIFLAGKIGTDPKTEKLAEGGIEAETEQALRNIEVVLKAAGSDFESVVKTTVFLADMDDFAKMNEVYGKFFKVPYPARSTVQVARLPRDAKIEIEVTALRK